VRFRRPIRHLRWLAKAAPDGPSIELLIIKIRKLGRDAHFTGGSMFRFKKPKLETQQWVLYSILAVSLGFNISMNPEHFSHFARNEKLNYGNLDLAQTAASPESGKMMISGKQGIFNVTFFEVQNSTFAKFERIEDSSSDPSETAATSPATECSLCNKPIPLSAAISDTTEIAKELARLVESGASAETADAKPKAPQKSGEATEVDLEAWAKKCDSYTDREESESRMECHKGQLIKLSKYLKNSKDNQGLVLEYFNEYLKGDLQRAFKASTMKPNDFGYYENDPSLLEFAQQMSEELISSLRPQNGLATVRVLEKLNANAYLYQLQNAQNLVRRGQQTNNIQMVQAGMNGMNPYLLRALLSNQQSSLAMAIDGMPGRNSMDMAIKDLLTSELDTSFYSPVNSTLTELERFLSPSNNDNNGQPRSLADFVITNSPYLLNDSVFSPDPSGQQTAMDMILGRTSIRGGQYSLLWSNNPGGIPTPVAPSYNQTPTGDSMPVTPRTARGSRPF
jgi:hypothetical protein